MVTTTIATNAAVKPPPMAFTTRLITMPPAIAP